MSAHDGGHLAAIDRVAQGIEMFGKVRPRVDDGDFLRPQQVGLRPVISERRGVVRKDACYPALELLQFGIGCVHTRASAMSRGALASN
jgi:hypothetical protein